MCHNGAGERSQVRRRLGHGHMPKPNLSLTFRRKITRPLPSHDLLRRVDLMYRVIGVVAT
jgi:hypothetical protein